LEIFLADLVISASIISTFVFEMFLKTVIWF